MTATERQVEIDRCLAEQRRAADELAAGAADRRGWWQAVTDWLMEEAILRST